MIVTATEPQTVSSLRANSLHDGLYNVALFAVIGLLFWAIDFNSNSEVSAARSVFTLLIPGLIIYELVAYIAKRRLLVLEP